MPAKPSHRISNGMFENEYVSLEKVARQLNLPQGYIRKLTKAGENPYLYVGGRLRYQVKSVGEALSRIEQKSIASGGQTNDR